MKYNNYLSNDNTSESKLSGIAEPPSSSESTLPQKREVQLNNCIILSKNPSYDDGDDNNNDYYYNHNGNCYNDTIMKNK